MKNLVPVAIVTIASVFAGIRPASAAFCEKFSVGWNEEIKCNPPNQNRGRAFGTGPSGNTRQLFIELGNPPVSTSMVGRGLNAVGSPIAGCQTNLTGPVPGTNSTSFGQCNTAVKFTMKIFF
jgi:hypothetical protein